MRCTSTKHSPHQAVRLPTGYDSIRQRVSAVAKTKEDEDDSKACYVILFLGRCTTGGEFGMVEQRVETSTTMSAPNRACSSRCPDLVFRYQLVKLECPFLASFVCVPVFPHSISAHAIQKGNGTTLTLEILEHWRSLLRKNVQGTVGSNKFALRRSVLPASSGTEVRLFRVLSGLAQGFIMFWFSLFCAYFGLEGSGFSVILQFLHPGLVGLVGCLLLGENVG